MGTQGGLAMHLVSYLTLWASCLIYLLPLRRRARHILRLAFCFILAVVLGILTWAVPFLQGLLYQCIFCLYAISFMWFCGDLSRSGAFYSSVWAVITQQLIIEVWHLCDRFGRPLFKQPGIWWLTGVLLFVIGFGAASLTLARWMPRDGRYQVGPRQLSSAMFLLILFEVLFWILVNGLSQDDTSAGILFLSQVYCATMLYFQDALFKKSAMKQELQTLNRLWYGQKEQYQLAKENIAIINRKCHDLKHQMAAMRVMVSSQEEQEKYLKEIEDAVRIYDSIVKTGNEVLDTVLTEKSLYCEANQITVNCVADGSRLSFLDPVDVYTILGNALDNAIESVRGFRNAEQRMIDVLVCIEQKFLVIQVINPLNEVLAFEDGLPVSTKPHDGYHGFGLKSIRHTVEKYGGFLTAGATNHCFALKMLIPLPQ